MRRGGQQVTIARPVSKEGVGLHTGEECKVRLVPAEPDAGIVFVWGCGVEVRAVAEHVTGTRRGTSLGGGGREVGNAEHLLAALYGMGVDNVRVEVEGPEVPACDGSAKDWVALLRRAGRRGLGAALEVRGLEEGVWVGGGDGWEVAAPGRGGLALAVAVEFPGTVVGRQTLWVRVSRGSFVRELAPARTFGFMDELEGLRAEGLARGGSGENAFGVGGEGYVGELRFPDEVVRHKALDLLGDLALCGWRFEGQVVAVRPSHRMNVELAGGLRARFLGEAS